MVSALLSDLGEPTLDWVRPLLQTSLKINWPMVQLKTSCWHAMSSGKLPSKIDRGSCNKSLIAWSTTPAGTWWSRELGDIQIQCTSRRPELLSSACVMLADPGTFTDAACSLWGTTFPRFVPPKRDGPPIHSCECSSAEPWLSLRAPSFDGLVGMSSRLATPQTLTADGWNTASTFLDNVNEAKVATISQVCSPDPFSIAIEKDCGSSEESLHFRPLEGKLDREVLAGLSLWVNQSHRRHLAWAARFGHVMDRCGMFLFGSKGPPLLGSRVCEPRHSLIQHWRLLVLSAGSEERMGHGSSAECLLHDLGSKTDHAPVRFRELRLGCLRERKSCLEDQPNSSSIDGLEASSRSSPDQLTSQVPVGSWDSGPLCLWILDSDLPSMCFL